MHASSVHPIVLPKPSDASNAPSSPVQKSPSPKDSPSNANCNNSASRAKTPKKVSPPTSRNAKAISLGNKRFLQRNNWQNEQQACLLLILPIISLQNFLPSPPSHQSCA